MSSRRHFLAGPAKGRPAVNRALGIGAAATAVLGAATWGVVGQAGAVAFQAPDSSAQGQVQTFTVRWEQVKSAQVDVGRTGDSPGDYFLFSLKWYNQAGTRVIGKALARCEIGLPATRRTCELTARLADRGKIRVAGTFFGPNDHLNVVTGGTGHFFGVDGSLRVNPDKPLFVIRLVR